MKRMGWFILIFTASIGISVWGLTNLPDTITIFWGIDGSQKGEVDKRLFVVGLPLFILLVFTFFQILSSFLRKAANSQRLLDSYWIIQNALLLFLLALQVILVASAVGWITELFLGLSLLVGCLYLSIGNILPRIDRNLAIWPESLKQASSMDKKLTRLLGYVFVITGICLMLNIFIPVGIRSYSFTFILVGMALVKAFFAIKYGFNYPRDGVKS